MEAASTKGSSTLAYWVRSRSIHRATITILGRTQAKGYAETEITFSDAGQVPDWAAGYLRSLVGQGVITGNDNRIRPNDLLTRGEVAKLLYAML